MRSQSFFCLVRLSFCMRISAWTWSKIRAPFSASVVPENMEDSIFHRLTRKEDHPKDERSGPGGLLFLCWIVALVLALAFFLRSGLGLVLRGLPFPFFGWWEPSFPSCGSVWSSLPWMVSFSHLSLHLAVVAVFLSPLLRVG